MAKQNNYSASSIRTATGLLPIREQHSMFGFDVSSEQAQYLMFKEIIDNCIDEATIDANKEHFVDISICPNKDSYQVIIKDTGRGVPLSKLVPAFTQLFTSGKKAESDAYEVSIGTFGIGAKGTAGLSDKFVAITKRKEGEASVFVERGEVVSCTVENLDDGDKTSYGTTIIFSPDTSILFKVKGFMESDWFIHLKDLMQIFSVFVPNVTLRIWEYSKPVTRKTMLGHCSDILKSVNSQLDKRSLIFETIKGLTPIKHVVKKYELKHPIVWQSGLIHKPLSPLKEDRLGYDIELFVTKDCGKGYSRMSSTVNLVPIYDKESHHNKVLFKVLKSYIAPFIKESTLRAFFEEAYSLPIHASIQVKWKKAVFLGQSKDKFRDADFQTAYKHSLTRFLDVMRNEYWVELFQLMEDDIVTKYYKSVGSSPKNLSTKMKDLGCFEDCRSTDNNITELLIAEGEAAGSAISQRCNKDFQAVFKLQGKPINAIQAKLGKLNKDKIFKNLKTVIGVDPSHKDLSKMRFARIGIYTDADEHGHHIVTLLMGIFHMINPRIISEGRVFVGNPPAYSLDTKRSTHYLRDSIALMDAKINHIYSEAMSLSIETVNGVKHVLFGSQFRDVCYLIDHIGQRINNVASKLGIDPNQVEQLAHCTEFIQPGRINCEGIRQLLGFDRVEYHAPSNSIIMSYGFVDETISMDRVVDELRQFILPILDEVNWKGFNILVTSKHSDTCVERPMSFSEIYGLFKSLDKNIHVDKMKGLNELGPEAMRYTCLQPDTREISIIRDMGTVDTLYNILGKDSAPNKQLLMKRIFNG